MNARSAILGVLLLVGCVHEPVLPPTAMLPESARTRPQSYLIVTVRNPVATAPSRAASTPRGYDGTGPYIAGGSALALSRALAVDYGLTEVSSWPIALLGVHCLVYGLPHGTDRSQIAAAMKRDRRVESVQPLQTFTTEADPYNDPYAQLQENLRQMSIPQAQRLSRGRGIRIAIIDTGVDLSHPDLRPAALHTQNFVDRSSAQFRADPHGTAVAGVIGAVPNNGVGIVGIAPGAELYLYKACWRKDNDGVASVCDTFTLARALAAAIEAHANVINLSLGGPSDPLLTRLVRRGLAAGAIIVGAMPRDGIRRGFPVEIDGVIAVDAAERGPTAPGVIRAPGSDVLSLSPGGHYEFYSGSSMAAAEISGVVALLEAKLPRLTPAEARSALADSEDEHADGPNVCVVLNVLLRQGDCEQARDAAAVAAPSVDRE